MISTNTKRAYSEVDTLLEYIGPSRSERIPLEIRNFIKKNKDQTYTKEIVESIPLKEQNFSKRALSIFAYLDLAFMCDSPKLKEKLIKIYTRNQEINDQEALKRKQNWFS